MSKSKRQRLIDLLANLSPGVAAQKSQIKAFQHYYNMNTPQKGKMFVAVDEIFLGGLVSTSTPLNFLFRRRGSSLVLNLGFNAFGGIVRWSAAPDQKLIGDAYDFEWVITYHGPGQFLPFNQTMSGYISYMDDTGVRHNRKIDSYKDSLVPWVLVTKVTVPVFAKLRSEGKMKMENGQIYQRVEP